jgi:hypothetical protein
MLEKPGWAGRERLPPASKPSEIAGVKLVLLAERSLG